MLDNCPKNRSTPLFMHVIAVFLPSKAILDNALPGPCTLILTDFKRLIVRTSIKEEKCENIIEKKKNSLKKSDKRDTNVETSDKSDSEQTEAENDAAHLELLQELQELSGTVSSDFSSFLSINFLFFLSPDFSSFLSTDFSLLSSVLSINFKV
jgi:hypothetical protein